MAKHDRLASLARRIRRAQAAARDEPRPASYQASRARREAAAAELAEITLAERAGALMETAAVHATLARLAAVIRARLAPLPVRLALEIAAVRGDEAAIANTLERGIHHALVDVADHLEHNSAVD